MNASVAAAKKGWTEAELQALPKDGFIHELIDGELVSSPLNDSYHGCICVEICAALFGFVEPRRLGVVLEASVGFWMENGNCRGADASFISRARLKANGFTRTTRRFFPGAPDLAVEVLALHDTREAMDKRLKDYFASGTLLAWIIDPKVERVEVCRSLTERRRVVGGAFLDGEDLLPGFSYRVADLFKPWDWEQDYD